MSDNIIALRFWGATLRNTKNSLVVAEDVWFFLYITVISRLPEPLLLKWINPIHSMQNTLDLSYSVEWNYLSIPRSQQLYRWNVGNGELISSHALLDMWLLIHAEIKSMLLKYAPGVIRVFTIL